MGWSTRCCSAAGLKHADRFYTKDGEAVLIAVGTTAANAAQSRQPLGAVPEGVAFSPDSQFVYIGNYSDKNLQVFRIPTASWFPRAPRSSSPASPPPSAAPLSKPTQPPGLAAGRR